MFYFIVNPIAGDGNGLKIWKEVKEYIESKNIQYEYIFTELKKDYLQKKLKNMVDLDSAIFRVIVIGGDGSINDVIDIIRNTNIQLGVIPAGTGNDFARSNNIPLDPIKAMDRIINCKSDNIDLLFSKDRYFANVLSIGFDAKVAAITNQSKIKHFLNKIKLGKFSYIINAILFFFTYKPSTIQVEIDNIKEDINDVWLIAVANSPYYGGGLKICPKADNKDGKLDVCIITSQSRLRLLPLFYKVYKGTHINNSSVKIYRGKQVYIASPQLLNIQGDGEDFGVNL